MNITGDEVRQPGETDDVMHDCGSGRRHDEMPYRDQSARLKITVPLVPPNPKEFDRATLMGISRAVWGT